MTMRRAQARYLRAQQGAVRQQDPRSAPCTGFCTPPCHAWGKRLAAKHEIRIAAMFQAGRRVLARMIVVHELASLRERTTTKAFYQLCTHMEPQYHQYEFDLRLYLTHVEQAGATGSGLGRFLRFRTVSASGAPADGAPKDSCQRI